MTKLLTPFLKWAGGKTWLAPRLAEIYEPFRNTHTWVEPFCGALGATLGVMPERAILNDVNAHLINLYIQIDMGLQSFLTHNMVDGSALYWQNSKKIFDLIKRDLNRSADFNSEFSAGNLWMAKAFYYLNRTCFNGLCRFNKKGEFNVGYGKYKNPKLDHDFDLYRDVFKNWRFSSLESEEFLKGFLYELIPYLFIYADPPYDDGFTSYSGSFAWADQVKLATQLSELDCPVVASNKATDRIVALYKGLGFDVEIVSAPRKISCNGDRTNVDEILATRNIK